MKKNITHKITWNTHCSLPLWTASFSNTITVFTIYRCVFNRILNFLFLFSLDVIYCRHTIAGSTHYNQLHVVFNFPHNFEAKKIKTTCCENSLVSHETCHFIKCKCRHHEFDLLNDIDSNSTPFHWLIFYSIIFIKLKLTPNVRDKKSSIPYIST